jgi:hypothetical protein
MPASNIIGCVYVCAQNVARYVKEFCKMESASTINYYHYDIARSRICVS